MIFLEKCGGVEIRYGIGQCRKIDFFLLLKDIYGIPIRNDRDMRITTRLHDADRFGIRRRPGFQVAAAAKEIPWNVAHDPVAYRRILPRGDRVGPRSIGVPIEIQHYQGIEFSRIGLFPPHERSNRYVRLQEKISASHRAVVVAARDGEAGCGAASVAPMSAASRYAGLIISFASRFRRDLSERFYGDEVASLRLGQKHVHGRVVVIAHRQRPRG